MVEIKIKTANRSNYGGKRSNADIKYIVIHYTANDGDTDEGNGNYFANNIVGASAHYFVDDDSITRSVPDDYIAWRKQVQIYKRWHVLWKMYKCQQYFNRALRHKEKRCV